jgi:hypothetical protein
MPPRTDVAPGPLVATDLAQDVVVLYVCGSLVAGSRVRPDHAAHAQRGLDLLGFEILVEELRDALPGKRVPVLFALWAVEGAFDVFPCRTRTV